MTADLYPNNRSREHASFSQFSVMGTLAGGDTASGSGRSIPSMRGCHPDCRPIADPGRTCRKSCYQVEGRLWMTETPERFVQQTSYGSRRMVRHRGEALNLADQQIDPASLAREAAPHFGFAVQGPKTRRSRLRSLAPLRTGALDSGSLFTPRSATVLETRQFSALRPDLRLSLTRWSYKAHSASAFRKRRRAVTKPVPICKLLGSSHRYPASGHPRNATMHTFRVSLEGDVYS